MKRLFSLLTISCITSMMFADVMALNPATVLADTAKYAQADYTVPSYTQYLIAKETAKASPTEANLQALHDRMSELQGKEEPYCMVANINGDPATRMAFCWFTNEGVEKGEVQLVANADATEADFAGSGVITVAATNTLTKGLRYTGAVPYITKASGIKSSIRYKYNTHKALAENLTPGTEYSWRVGYAGHWSKIAHFRTMDEKQGEFSFIYMTDSHIMNDEYISHARRCALAAAKTVPEARFCVFPGDFVEDGGGANSEWEWERWFEEALNPVIMQMPIVPTDGNHDDSPNINYTYHFNTDNEFNREYTNKPQFEGIVYSFVYGDALFLVYSMQDFWREPYSYNDFTSTYLGTNLGRWFRTKTAQNADTKYRLTLSHFNLFSGSDHSVDEEPPLFRATMLPTLKACEIDVALQGHDHTYEVIGPVNPDNCTPILSAITDREEVAGGNSKNMTGYKGGTYCTDDGTLFFIGATCGRKRYYPHTKARMENDYTEDSKLLQDGKHHNVKNYFDLFTGMFGQPEAPSFTKITVKDDCIEFNSYTADDDEGNVTLINTMRIVRNKEHTIPTGFEDLTPEQAPREGQKFIRNNNIYILHNGKTYNLLGVEVK
ncbi:MAG: metallophosphoesterase family protein [Paludibacteraceae bacterium]|nr:metallophosphoesterase family protein [Paludibacteraceae bacterium]